MSEPALHCWPATGYARFRDLTGDRRANPPRPGYLGWSRSELYRRIASGDWPPPLKLGKRTAVWDWSVVHAARRELEKKHALAASPAKAA